MNCKNCGEKLSAFSAYCEKCGSKELSIKEWLLYYGTILIAFLKKRKWIAIGVAAAVVILIAGGVMLNASKQLDPMDYLVINTSGYSGAGAIGVEIDTQSLAEKLLGPVPDKSSAKGYERYSQYKKQLERLQYALFASADVYRGLSNDDFFLATVTIADKEFFEECGVKLKDTVYSKALQIGKDCGSFELPVEVSLLEFVPVMFSGENGSGYIVISDEKIHIPITFSAEDTTELEILCYENWFSQDYTCSIYCADTGISESIKLSIDNSSKLSNGNIITISISDSDIKNLIAHGVLITPSSKSFQVTGLS